MRGLPLIVSLLLLAGCAGDAKKSPSATPPPEREAAPPPAADPRDPGPAPPIDPAPEPPVPAPPPPEPVARLAAHTIALALDPATHALEATDTLELEGAGLRSLDLDLNSHFDISAVTFGRLAAAWTFHDGTIRIDFPAPSEERFTVTVAYKGTLFDPPHRDEVRFVVGEKCAGTIQPEGAFLPGSAGWYPDVAGSMARFTVSAKVPEDWEFIGQGARHDYDAKTKRCTWCDPVPADRLDCVAGPYVAEELKAGRVTVRSFFFKEDLAAAEGYRKAAIDWIAHFSELLGPYAYDDFSIVENFFSTGYGMPSFTLLGADVIRMGSRYLGEGGLGHEILHCWWGNGVFVEGGNWCEALTTYCSNYLWVELSQGPEAARKYRRHAMVRYSMNVDAASDYPVRKFMSKTTDADNEIGYGKGSMLFHYVRQLIGDKAFWAALHRIVRDRTGTRATWDDFRRAFEAESGEKLEKIFGAWLDQKGAPEIKLARTPKGIRMSVDKWEMDLHVKVRTLLPAGPAEDDERLNTEWVDRTPAEGATRIEVDPDYDVFHRIPPEALPICLNRVVVDPGSIVVVPDGDASAYSELIGRLDGWKQLKAAEATAEALKGHSVLVLGGPDTNALTKRWAVAGKLDFDGVEMRGGDFTTPNGKCLVGADAALLLTCASPDDPSHHAAIFFPASAGSAKPARLLLYYGWDSWVEWRGGKIAARGEFPVKDPLALDLK